MISNRATDLANRDLAVHWVTLERAHGIAAVLLDPEGTVLRYNDHFRDLVVGAAQPDSANLAAWLEGGEAWEDALDRSGRGEAGMVRLVIPRVGLPDLALRGELIQTAIESASPCVVGMFVSAAEVDTAQSIIARNARLEALVCLTSGVAHDFNNLLTILSGNLALAAEDVRSQPKTFAKLKSARDAANRGGELIRQLLSFARQKEIGSELIDPARIVRRVAPLIERALGSSVELALDLDDGAGQIYASAVQFESAIVNLAVNARDAMEEGGRVCISVKKADPRGNRLSGASTEVAVADNGPGIPSDLVEKVLTPFFTTKGDSGGTGLGLSMVDAFVTQHRGQLEIDSTVGQGTIIKLIFPRAGDNLDESIAGTMPLLALPSGDEIVVVVARDKSLRSTVEQILTVLGYTVVPAEGLHEAIHVIRERAPQLIVADGFDVRALLNACAPGNDRQKCRGLELIAQSESAQEATGQSANHAIGTLSKPFSLPDLARGVRSLLDRD